MSHGWSHIHTGTEDGRTVVLKEHNDEQGRSLRVETTFIEDGMLGDGAADTDVSVLAGDPMHIHAETPDELRRELIENGFSEQAAANLARLAMLPTDKSEP